MKQIVKLIVENKKSAADYVAQLSEVFGDAITILPYQIDEDEAYLPHKEAAILTTAHSSSKFSEIRKTHFKGQSLIFVSLALPRKRLHMLHDLPSGTPALLVNNSKFMAEETIAQLYQAGCSNLAFQPWFPGCDTPILPLAVTPGEAELLPEGVETCVDLGPRLIDVVTIVELAARLHCEYLLRTPRFFDYFSRQYNTSTGVSILVNENQLLEQRLSTLTHMYGAPLLGIDQNDHIFDCGFQAAELFGTTRSEMLQTMAEQYIPQAALERCRNQQVHLSQSFTDQRGHCRDVHLMPITLGTQYMGAYATFSAQETRKKDDSRPSQGHIAKYNFSDICGFSPLLLQTVELARKMARTDSPVLISGESGTGKELFAHAIHNSSARADRPFVAVNCAALPDNLLESELFGYDEGAFTGARKGGKLGLFELANTGSIFLDEIEGMSPSTQLKLLRAIQEQEIMRVGGNRVIPIDVRIISATNQDMISLIENGRFRRDLFYRVGTLPLDIPPLRRRREDILPLIGHFQNVLRQTFILTEETRTLLQRYNWPGNIRELRNCVEYMSCQNLSVITPDSLPPLIRAAVFSDAAERNEGECVQTQLLKLLSVEPCGRKQLLRALSANGYRVTEGQLRRELEQLKAQGLITSTTGRSGSRLTSAGVQELKNRLK